MNQKQTSFYVLIECLLLKHMLGMINDVIYKIKYPQQGLASSVRIVT